jgi:hypothetical protein
LKFGTVKNDPNALKLFTTSATDQPRNAALKMWPSSVAPPGFKSINVMRVRLSQGPYDKDPGAPIPPEARYGFITGLADVPIPKDFQFPGDGWNNAKGNLKIPTATCSPPLKEMADMWTHRERKDRKVMWQELANQMVRCENLIPPWGGFNLPPEEEKEDLVDFIKEEVKSVVPEWVATHYGKWLKAQAAKAGIQGNTLFAFLDGPASFLAWAKKTKKVDPSATSVPIAALADAMHYDVMGVSQYSPAEAHKAIFQLSRFHGENYGKDIEKMLLLSSVSKKAAAKKAKSAKIKMGILPPSFGLMGGKGDAFPIYVPPSYSQGDERGKVDRQADQTALEWEQDFDANQLDNLAADAQDIADAIKDYLACAPGSTKVLTRKLRIGLQYKTDRIVIACGSDPATWDQTNPAPLADALRAELAAQVSPPTEPTADEKGSALPWILAGLGLFAGGPLGAGAGFAIGKTMEAK